MIEPMVCVPSASGQSPAATAAAEPLLDPPGVCSGWCGLRVGPGREVGELGGDRLAQDQRARLAQPRRRLAASGPRTALGRQAAAGARREAVDVEDVLDADRHAEQRRAVRIEARDAREGLVRLAVQAREAALLRQEGLERRLALARSGASRTIEGVSAGRAVGHFAPAVLSAASSTASTMCW